MRAFWFQRRFNQRHIHSSMKPIVRSTRDFQIQNPITLRWSRTTTFKWMLGIISAFAILNPLVSIPYFYLDDYPLRDFFYYLLNVDTEQSLPTIYSVYSIQICALLLGLISFIVKSNSLKYFKHWMFLTFTFLYLSFDEYLSIHERFSKPTREILSATGFFHHAWIIPALILVTAMFFSYLKFIFDLPKIARNLVLLSGFSYIFGAICMEMIGGKIVDLSGNNLYVIIETSFEEFFEMLGIATFIFALLYLLENQLLTIKIKIEK